MKLNFFHALAIAGLSIAFTSCSNNDDPVKAPGSTLEVKTYTSADGLVINLNGVPLIGKTATFTPGSDGKATVTLAGEPLDMSEIMENLTKAESSPTFPTAGVLPGSPKVDISVDLKGESDNCTFEGNGETDYCTFSYSGAITAETLNFDLKDVKLKNTSLAGTWTLPELYEIDPDFPDFGPSVNMYNVARVVWQSENTIEVLPGFPMSAEAILGMTLAMPMIGDADQVVSPLEMLTVVLKSVTFSEDGTVTAEYLNTADMTPVKAPAGIAQYVITSEGNLRLFLNPFAIIVNSVKAAKISATRAADIAQIVDGMMQQLIPMLSQGIPVNYGKAIANAEGELNDDTNILSFYLGTETLLPLLKTLSPLLTDEEFVNGIVEDAQKDPNMGSMAGMLPTILQSLPGVIDTTSKIEIGINLKK